MFKELHPLIKQTRLLILVSAEGDLLRVNITPKSSEGENPALSTPLSLLAIPEELDAQLPEILTEYTGAHMDLRTSLNNAIAQIGEAKAGPGKKPEAKPAAAKKSDAKKPDKAKAELAEPAVPASPDPEKEPEAPVDKEPPAEEAAIAATQPEAPDENEESREPQNEGSDFVEQEQPSTPIEAVPTADEEPAPEPEIPTAPEKDTNTIELF